MVTKILRIKFHFGRTSDEKSSKNSWSKVPSKLNPKFELTLWSELTKNANFCKIFKRRRNFRTPWVIDFTTKLVKLASFLLVNLPYDALKTILKSILYKYFLYFMSHSGFQISSKWVQNRISRENGTTWLHLPATGCNNSCWIFSAAWWTHMNGLWFKNYE